MTLGLHYHSCEEVPIFLDILLHGVHLSFETFSRRCISISLSHDFFVNGFDKKLTRQDQRSSDRDYYFFHSEKSLGTFLLFSWLVQHLSTFQLVNGRIDRPKNQLSSQSKKTGAQQELSILIATQKLVNVSQFKPDQVSCSFILNALLGG